MTLTMKTVNPAISPMRAFDPRKVAQFEVDNYVAYYRRQWPRLLVLTIGLVREAFRLPLVDSVRGAYRVARAEFAAAPFPDNDIAQAEAHMQRFYALLRRANPRERFDPATAARLDVRWWVVHRERFADPANQPLVDALVDLSSHVYGLPRERMLESATLRAQAMLISDRWVRAGRDPHSPMLAEEKAVMERAYVALRETVNQSQPAAEPIEA
jgi:hypothetical protein